MLIETKFEVGQKVAPNFDNGLFERGFGIVREVNIKISSVGYHVEYAVADIVEDGVVARELKIDEADLDPVVTGRRRPKRSKK